MIVHPACCGVSGTMNSLVNQDGVANGENLGKDMMAIASKMTTFHPDARWIQVSLPAKARSQSP